MTMAEQTYIVKIHPVDDVYIQCLCEPGIAQELCDYFTFDVPNARFHPLYKNKIWDGKYRLYDVKTRLVYAGLLPYVVKFCEDRGYGIDLDSLPPNQIYIPEDYGTKLGEDTPYEVRDYQNSAVVHLLRQRRTLTLCPTGSGKSFIMYLAIKHHLKAGHKVLLIVPKADLVQQLNKEFTTYNNGPLNTHLISAGADKEVDADIVLSTWQSIYKLPAKWFQRFDVVIGDEVHLFEAKSLQTLMKKTTKSPYKYGFTGTLKGAKTHKLTLEGLFGTVNQVTTSSKLMEEGYLAELKINAVILKHPEQVRQEKRKYTYQQEIDYIVQCDKRNRFIKNLALNIEGNSLLLFQYVEKHGKVLYDLLKDERENCYFIHGGVDVGTREDVRTLVEDKSDAIIVASYGTFSTATNIRNLHNLVFCSPSKSRIRNLQSIGRGLRKSDTKDNVVLYDIVDDLSWKSRENYALKHFKERVDIYLQEGFSFKMYPIDL